MTSLKEKLVELMGLTPKPALEARVNHYNGDVARREQECTENMAKLRVAMNRAITDGNPALARQYAVRIAQEEKRLALTSSTAQAVRNSMMSLENARMIKQTADLAKESVKSIQRTQLPRTVDIERVSDQLQSVNDTIDESARAFDDFSQLQPSENSRVDELLQKSTASYELDMKRSLAEIPSTQVDSRLSVAPIGTTGNGNGNMSSREIYEMAMLSMPSVPSSTPSSAASSSSTPSPASGGRPPAPPTPFTFSLLSSTGSTPTPTSTLSASPSPLTSTTGGGGSPDQKPSATQDFFADLGLT